MHAPRSDHEQSKIKRAFHQEIPRENQPRLLRPLGHVARALGQEVLAVMLLVVVAAAIVWFYTPYYLRDYLNKRGSELPDYICHINWVRIHPLTAGIDLYDIKLDKKSGKIPVPFYTSPRIHISMQWSRLLHGDFRSKIILHSPIVNFVQGPTEDQSQTFLEPAWVEAVKQLVPLKINHFEVHQGTVHFYDFHAEPQIDLYALDVELVASNLTNSQKSKSEMPSAVVLKARPFNVGELDAQLAVNVDLKQPTFAEKIRLDKIPAPALNSFLAKYGSVYAKSGELAFYTEMVSRKGHFEGYVKPYFQDLEFEPVPKDRGGLGAIWASMANGLKSLLENRKDTVATNIPISGNYQDPDVDFWSAAFGVVRNAYFEALAKDFNKPELAPAPAEKARKK